MSHISDVKKWKDPRPPFYTDDRTDQDGTYRIFDRYQSERITIDFTHEKVIRLKVITAKLFISGDQCTYFMTQISQSINSVPDDLKDNPIIYPYHHILFSFYCVAQAETFTKEVVALLDEIQESLTH